ncbi:MAG: ABC-F family ATP-binding cassette domain-containing protein [Treponema sp.]|jgi:ATP-binding cassette subfamily F protein 3|nr:ABC-F family ATP-binding cassette domain-containing protein [Treponema sp.]
MRLQCSRISVAFGGRDVLKNVSLLLSTSPVPSKAALAGINGSGKSTLLQIAAGIKEPDSGERFAEKGCRVSYLPQSGLVFAGHTLREEAETAYHSVVTLLDAMENTGKRLEQSTRDDKATAALLEEYHRLQQIVEDSGYYRREETIEQVLEGLGFSRTSLDRECGAFSGGWQMRIALAKVLLENPDIMLLDEPTNYLDIEARTWLEAWLKRFTGGYLLVSHDRYFLDVTVNEVYEINRGVLKRYAGNYSAYEKTLTAERESLLKRYEEQQEEIAKTEALIQRFRYKATKAAMVQERIRKLEKMERIEIPESLKKISIAFPPAPRSGRVALFLEKAGKRYGSTPVLSGLDLALDAGEKLVVAGKNGAGKTTLLRIIAGRDSAHEGTVRYGTGITAGYFSQDSAFSGSQDPSFSGSQDSAEFRGGTTVLAFMEAAAPAALVPRLRDMLGAFLFRGDDVYKPLSVLSGGEKSRLALLRLLLKPLNLLVLDEPTNHLDLHSKDILLDALLRFTGTIVFVSHDRSFMEALSTKTLELRSGADSTNPAKRPGGPSMARLFYGGYGYYLERLEREAAEGLKPAVQTPVKAPEEIPGSAGSREEAKRRRTLLRRLERQEADILRRLEELEAEKSRLERELARPEVYSLGERAAAVKAALDGVSAELEAKTAEWEEKTRELENAESESQGM